MVGKRVRVSYFVKCIIARATGMYSERKRSVHSARMPGCLGETYNLCFQPDSPPVTQVQAC